MPLRIDTIVIEIYNVYDRKCLRIHYSKENITMQSKNVLKVRKLTIVYMKVAQVSR